MKLYRISWFDEFECLGGKCPMSCCKGWRIPLTPEDCTRLRKERGRRGLALFFATAGWSRAHFNNDSMSCPFWDRDGLCRLQKEKGHDFIPETCRDFPRFYRNYGPFEETYASLSCIGAARLFMKHIDDLTLTLSEGEPESELCTTNDDIPYLEFLVSTRGQMISAAISSAADGTFGADCDALYEYACHIQDEFATGKNEKRGTVLFPVPVPVLKKLLNSPLRHRHLKTVNPILYDMFEAADKHLAKCRKEGRPVGGNVPDEKVYKVCAAYLSYYLYMHFLRTYETYGIRKQIALGIVHVNMIYLLINACCEGESVTDEQIARIIAAYNGRAYFNDHILDEMYKIFENAVAGRGTYPGGADMS